MNYCKHCGTALETGAVKCLGCGAAVDYTDGGQSYMTDAEIGMWRHKMTSDSSIPLTKEVNLRPAGKLKNKKRGFDLSNPNAVIAVCAITAVTVLLLVAAIIVVVTLPKGGKDKSDEQPPAADNAGVQSDEPVQAGFEDVVKDAFDGIQQYNQKIIEQNKSEAGVEE